MLGYGLVSLLTGVEVLGDLDRYEFLHQFYELSPDFGYKELFTYYAFLVSSSLAVVQYLKDKGNGGS